MYPPAGTIGLRDFLTDGSLARLCSELSRLGTGCVELRDEADRLVIVDSDGWTLGDASQGLRPEQRTTIQPLIVGGVSIGAIVASEPRPGELATLLPLIAQTAVEWCSGFLELRHAIDELGVLIELSSLLVGTSDVASMVERALTSVLRVLELDAGSVVMFPEDADGILSDDEHDLVLSAAQGLSREWLANPESLSQGRVFDRLALSGDVVSIEDLRADPRVRNDDQVATEGVRAFMCAGLLFRGRPVGVIRVYSRKPRVFSELDKRLLRGIAHQAAAAVQQSRLIQQRQRDAETERQVRLAADVQQRMLPKTMPRDRRVDIAARYQPSFELAGDFYDIFEIGGRFAIVVGDVAGKGVPAAMLMSLARASFRAHAERGLSPHDVVARVNRDMCRDTLVSEFATIWYGVLDPATGSLEFASAGHEPPMIVRTAGPTEDLPIGGLAAGIEPEARYTTESARLAPGDVLVTFTDGVPDVMSFEGKRFGKARLRAVLEQGRDEDRGASAADIMDRVFRELRQFGGLRIRPDDTTLLIVRYPGA